MSSIICSFLSVDLLGTTHMLWDVTTTIFRSIWIVVSLNDWQRSELMTVPLLHDPVCLKSPQRHEKNQQTTRGGTEGCTCWWIDCAQAREQRYQSRKDETQHTLESRLFRSRTGLCRKTICLVDTLPSLHQKKEVKKHSKSSDLKCSSLIGYPFRFSLELLKKSGEEP